MTHYQSFKIRFCLGTVQGTDISFFLFLRGLVPADAAATATCSVNLYPVPVAVLKIQLFSQKVEGALPLALAMISAIKNLCSQPQAKSKMRSGKTIN